MKTLHIAGTKRQEIGKSLAKKLRNEEQIPCVVYGGRENVHFSAPKNSFTNLIYTPDVYSVELDIEGEKISAILQDVQFHPVTENILHIDFVQLIPGNRITMKVPVKLVGTPIGVKNGGNLRLLLRKLLIRALPENLPENIEINIEALEIGDNFKVNEISDENLRIMNEDDEVIVAVKRARVFIEVEEEEEGEEGEEGVEGEEGEEGKKDSDSPEDKKADSKEEDKQEKSSE